MKLHLLVAVAAVVAGCSSETRVEPVTTTGATMPTTTDSGIALLARTRCEHEAVCGHVGPAGRFTSEAACDVATRFDERRSIGLESCPLGVDADQLRLCVSSIEARPCSAAIPTLDGIADCRPFEMCRTP